MKHSQLMMFVGLNVLGTLEQVLIPTHEQLHQSPRSMTPLMTPLLLKWMKQTQTL